MITALAAGLPLASNDFGDTQSDGIAGPVGLLIIVVLVIATVFLIRNMSSRIKRLPASFDKTPADQPEEATKQTDQTADETRTD
jgi:ABC-type Fe3+ transport system permease subunit